MRISDDERRDVAARLRKTRGIMAFVEALGIDPDGDWYWTDVSRRVADLIDRPTCHICETDHECEGSVRCDRCRMTFMRPWEPFKYCPECGARVVSSDDASRD